MEHSKIHTQIEVPLDLKTPRRLGTQVGSGQGLFAKCMAFFFSLALLANCTQELPEEETLLQLLAFLSADLGKPAILANTNLGLYYTTGPNFQRFLQLPTSGITGFASTGKHLLVGTGSGLYISHRYGYTFSIAPFPLASANIVDVASDPVTGELSVFSTGFYYHSTNGGYSFTQKPLPPATPVRASVFNGKILVCTTLTGTSQVFLSEDRGNSFQAIGPASSTGSCNHVLYLENLSTGSGTIFLSTSTGLFVSANRGASWLGPITSFGAGITSIDVRSVSVHESGTLYAALGTATGGISRSSSGIGGFAATSVTSRDVRDILAIESTVVACTTAGLFVSKDSGGSFLGPIANLQDFFPPASCDRLGVGHVSIKTVGF